MEFVTPAARAWLKRRASELAGLALLAAAAYVLVALLTADPADPSFNHATDAKPANLLGSGGAHAADLLLHLWGVAALAPILAVAAWGWRLLGKRGIGRPWLRLVALGLATIALSLAAAASSPPNGGATVADAGGVLGSLLFERVFAGIDAAYAETNAAQIALACGLVGAIAWFTSLGIPWPEWMAFGRLVNRAAASAHAACRGIYLRSLGGTPVLRIRGWRRGRRPIADDDAVLDPAAVDPQSAAKDTPVVVAAKPSPIPAGIKAERARQGRFEFEAEARHRPPPIDLLRAPPRSPGVDQVNREGLEQNARLLSTVLEDFGVRGEIVKIRPGPVVTLYELEPAPGTKTSRVIGLADDIARSMSAVSVRVAVVPGRNVIGIELPNARREMVFLRELLASETFERGTGALTLALGKDIGGSPILVDLARMPHLLIAGTTGSGKSVAINTMILSLLYQLPPAACKFILIDPKMLELSVYDGIPHLLAPVVTDPSKAVVALKWTVREMEERYRMMSQIGVRNIAGFNARVAEALRKGESLIRRVQTGFDDDGRPVYEEQTLDLQPLPFIVVVVDEMADLMLVAGKDIEAAVQRLSQMARAAGIHLLMATQRPSVDVITGTIKANFPTRVSFHVTSRIDSRTILGEQGAEQLLGQGDMLYMATGGRITRVHGPFVSDEEVEAVVRFLRSQGEPEYVSEVTEEPEDDGTWPEGAVGDDGSGVSDELYREAVAIVAGEGKASTSFVQRRLQIGYNRAARLIERMEAEGLVSKPDRVGRREILIGERGA